MTVTVHDAAQRKVVVLPDGRTGRLVSVPHPGRKRHRGRKAVPTMVEPGDAQTPPALVHSCRRGTNMPKGTCSIGGCERRHHARGWCSPHWKRWKRYGDPLGSRVLPLPDRFWPKVDQSGDCWLWTSATTRKGYGRIHVGPRTMALAHRVAYELLVGPIPEGLCLDHLCRNPACVNPAHLEPVTQRENVRRGMAGKHNSVKTHCPQGHPYSDDNLYMRPRGGRGCMTCARAALLRHRARKRVGS